MPLKTTPFLLAAVFVVYNREREHPGKKEASMLREAVESPGL
jgi:hypothetical protein